MTLTVNVRYRRGHVIVTAPCHLMTLMRPDHIFLLAQNGVATDSSLPAPDPPYILATSWRFYGFSNVTAFDFARLNATVRASTVVRFVGTVGEDQTAQWREMRRSCRLPQRSCFRRCSLCSRVDRDVSQWLNIHIYPLPAPLNCQFLRAYTLR